MPDFIINVCRRGYVRITASELDAATQRAVSLPDAAFTWEPEREFEDCYEDDGSCPLPGSDAE